MSVICVTGDRNWKHEDVVHQALSFINEQIPIKRIIHGGAKGADTAAGTWASSNNIECKVFSANWARYKKGAGPIRNSEMVKHLKDEKSQIMVIAFHDNLNESKGTKCMIKLTTEAGIEVLHFNSKFECVTIKGKKSKI